MGRHMTRGTVVLVDEPGRCEAPLAASLAYADRTVAVSDHDLGRDDAAEVVRPGRRGPTIDEAFRIAAERRMPWVAMRRDIAPPASTLAQLLEATGRRATKDVPGFGAILTGTSPRSLERILAVIDLRDGQPSGLMALAAVNIALATGADLEVLVLGAPGEELRAPATADDVLRIRRDRDLYDQARQRAEASQHRATWIAIDDPGDRVAITLDQVATGGYDLVIDDLGGISLGGRVGRGRRIRRALSPDGPGEIALALLERTDVATAIVLDAIRLGVVPPGVVKGGAGVLLALGVVAAAAPTATATAKDRARVHDSVSQSVDAYEQALEQAAALEAADDVGAATRTAQASAAAAAGTSDQADDSAPTEGAEAETGTDSAAAEAGTEAPVGGEGSAADPEPAGNQAPAEADAVPPGQLAPADVEPEKAPKVDPDSVQVPQEVAASDVEESQKAAHKAEQERSEAREAFSEAQSEAEQAVADVRASATAAESAATDLRDAQETYDEVYSETEATIKEVTSLSGGLRGSAADDQLASAEQAQAQAVQSVAQAGERAEEALADYQSAARQATESYADLERAAADVTEADVAYQEARAVATATQDAYDEMLATARVSPVPGYGVTTHHGATGPMWSTGTHTGVDYSAPSGTSVVAAGSGTVAEVSSGGAYGNRIVIDHADGTYTSYSHLSSVDVSVGQEVAAGQHIGAVGSTGNSSGPHLHFEVTQGGDGWSGGSFLDPEAWLAGTVDH